MQSREVISTVLHMFGASVVASSRESEPLLKVYREVVVVGATAGFCLKNRRNRGR